VPRQPSDRPREPPLGRNWALPIKGLSSSTHLLRVTQVRHVSPLHFGRHGTGRFDAPDGDFGVCYFGTTLTCCLLEVFSGAIRREVGRRLLAVDHLRSYRAVVATTVRSLRLAYMAGNGLDALGIDQRVTGGDDYDLSQRWAAAVHANVANVDGIYYPSRLHNALHSAALFERAQTAIDVVEGGHLGNPKIPDSWVSLNTFMDRFAIGLIEDIT
jgi:hypothetical protein